MDWGGFIEPPEFWRRRKKRLLITDEEIILIRSVNMDRRSFELNYEINMFVFNWLICPMQLTHRDRIVSVSYV